MTKPPTYSFTLCCLGLATLLACGDDGGSSTADAAPTEPDAEVDTTPTTYAFDSRFVPGESSVSYSEAVLRQVLVAELVEYLDDLTEEIDGDLVVPGPGEVEARLGFYYAFDSVTSGAIDLNIATEPDTLQSMYDDIGATGDLTGVIAGNDPVGQHEDWNTAFRGWTEGGVSTPDALIQYWFARLDELAVVRAADTIPLDPVGNPIPEVFITESGQDLQELLRTFLLAAVNTSQGHDRYLDDATADQGLLASNQRDGDHPYSALEHQWDLGFGYLGAARDYGDYTDDELAGEGGRADYQEGYHDSDRDGAIDLRAEYNFGHSRDAGERDLGSSPAATTDFTKATFDAFLAGRLLIGSADGELDAAAMQELVTQRDIIVSNWENAVAATVVHFINETLRDMNDFGTGEYAFADHAKHWSSLKGHALGLQFSPSSPLAGAQFEQLHELIGDAPVLPNAPAGEITAYLAGLLSARDIVGQAYGFDAANLGDEDGTGGW